MTWFGVGSGSRRAKPERAQRFEQADRVVVEAFADLHEARRLERDQFPWNAVQRFERKAWNRLIDYLMKLPPLPSDDRIATARPSAGFPASLFCDLPKSSVFITSSAL